MLLNGGMKIKTLRIDEKQVMGAKNMEPHCSLPVALINIVSKRKNIAFGNA